MRLRRQKSKKSRVVNAVGTYLKVKAATKLVKTVRKSVKGWAAYKVAKQAPKPVKALPVVAGVGVAGAVAARKRRHSEPTPA
jgi:hypothetical protein